MDLKEIVNRNPKIPVEQEECLFVIKEYIKIRKNVEVEPMIDTRWGMINTNLELTRMMQMFNHATAWLKSNHFKN